MSDHNQLHQGSAAPRPADKPQGGGGPSPRLKNSPTVEALRSQLADAALEWAAADRALDGGDDGNLDELCRRRQDCDRRLRELAAKIEAIK